MSSLDFLFEPPVPAKVPTITIDRSRLQAHRDCPLYCKLDSMTERAMKDRANDDADWEHWDEFEMELCDSLFENYTDDLIAAHLDHDRRDTVLLTQEHINPANPRRDPRPLFLSAKNFRTRLAEVARAGQRASALWRPGSGLAQKGCYAGGRRPCLKADKARPLSAPLMAPLKRAP